MLRVEINGAAPTEADLHRAAVVNYGHFTSMQVRQGAVRGLESHLSRLTDASREMFGAAPPRDDIRSFLRGALAAAPEEISARITVFSRSGDPSDQSAEPDLAVMVSLTDPVHDTPEPAWRAMTLPYRRELPHLKHTATMGLILGTRVAKANGFTEAVFVDDDGLVTEGSMWNLGLWDGEGVVWPRAPKLRGITEQLLDTALRAGGVPTKTRPVYTGELGSFRAGFACYSRCPAQPLASIDDVVFGDGEQVSALLRQAWRTVPWDTI